MYVRKRRTRSQTKSHPSVSASSPIFSDVSTPPQEILETSEIPDSHQSKVGPFGETSRQSSQPNAPTKPYRRLKTQLVRLPQSCYLYNRILAEAQRNHGNLSILFESLPVYNFMHGTAARRLSLITQLQKWKQIYCRFFKEG